MPDDRPKAEALPDHRSGQGRPPGLWQDLWQSRYAEATVSAVVFGVVFGAIMNVAITYAGLKIGFTINGSPIAAVLGFGVLRGLLRRGSILENNIGQTIASAVNTPCSGVIFTIPVLYLLDIDVMAEGRFWWLMLAGAMGAILGTAFVIPLRKQMIDLERLRFPSAVAVAAILKSPGAGARKSIVLLVGALVAVLIYLPAGLPSILRRVPTEQLADRQAQGEITAEQAEVTRQVAAILADGQIPPEKAQLGAAVAARLQEQGGQPAELGSVDRFHWMCHQIATGNASLATLKEHWVRLPLPGYAALNWRLAGGEPNAAELSRRVDRDGDGQRDLILQNEALDVGRWWGLPDYVELVFAIAPLSLGAGYLSGRSGLMVLAGGILAFFVLNPVAYSLGWMPATTFADQAPSYAYRTFNRPLGIGLLLGGALMGVLASLPSIVAALQGMRSGRRQQQDRDELGLSVLGITALVAGVLLWWSAHEVISGAAAGGLLSGLPLVVRSLVVAVAGIAWIWFAGIIIAQCTGMTDWSPISGMALLTVVLVMMLVGHDQVLGAITIGVALCVATTCAADMMSDLKTGYLVGAQPKRQQILELATVPLGPVIAMGTLLLIVATNLKKYGVPIGPGTETAAPQAQALQAVIQGVQGGEMPYALYGAGTVLGVLLGLGAFPGLGVLVGLSMYLPIQYILTYGLGCLANMVVSALKGPVWAEEWGVPFCAGLIVGEALLSMAINLIVLMV